MPVMQGNCQGYQHEVHPVQTGRLPTPFMNNEIRTLAPDVYTRFPLPSRRGELRLYRKEATMRPDLYSLVPSSPLATHS